MLEDNAANLIYTYLRFSKKDSVISCFIKKILTYRYGIFIGNNVEIGKGLILPHPQGIVIGNNVRIGDNVTIYQQVTIGRKNGEYPVIKSDCVIYAGAKVIGGIIISKGSIIGANAVVLNSTDMNGIYAGVPAKKRGSDKIIKIVQILNY